MARRSSLVVLFLLLIAAAPQPLAAQADTYGVTASILFCDIDPQAAPEGTDFASICGDAFAGTTIEVTADGDLIGSCETESVETPWGGIMNYCAVEGAPFNSTIVFTVDESTLPDGYVLEENPLSIEVDDLIPGGGDQTTVTFRAVLEEPPADDDDGAMPESETIGFNADILTGTCANPTGSAAILEAVVIETGTPVGSELATAPEVSRDTVDISLDLLIDEPHAVAIYGVNEHAGDRILCGEIGGVDNDDGVINIVLRPVADVEAGGLAILSYNAADANRTDVSLYVLPVE